MPQARRRAPTPPPPALDVSQTLATERLILRPPVPADAEQLHRLVNDWAVVRNLSRLPFPYPRTLTDEWIASTAEQRAKGTGYHLVITGHDAGQELVIGCVGLRLDVTPKVANLGYWVGRQYWGHGVATEAVHRVARWALANLSVSRIEAHVAQDNPASSAVLRRVGLRETGRGSEAFMARGGEHPVIRFEATREDLFGAVDTPPITAVPDLVPDAAPDAAPGLAPNLAPDAAPRAEPAKPLLLVAACALIDTDGRVLLARRPEGKKMAGLWEFPGGKLNPGETPEHALIRELKEELGIDVAQSCLAAFAFASHDYQRFHLLMPLFLCRRWKGTPTGLEGQALAWVRPNKLADYDMPPADKPLIPLLRDFL